MKRVVSWFQENHREYPFRKDPQPYHIWVSEIMLQQTRIETVIPYYERFIREVPDVPSLAVIPEERLYKLWEGLGYYSRVRNMKKAALQLVSEGQRDLPDSYDALIKLPGIGSYTAAAIASIAFHERVPAVDGNVLRVYQRFTGSFDDVLKEKTKKEVTSALKQYLDELQLDAGLFNQGMMELGEVVCLPNGAALCSECPLREDCRAFSEGLTGVLPVRKLRQEKLTEQKTVLIFRQGEKMAVVKRTAKDVLSGMYGFYMLEGHRTESELTAFLEGQGFLADEIIPLQDKKHVFTHRIWDMKAYLVRLMSERSYEALDHVPLIFVDKKELAETYALPKAFQKWEIE